jgi:hypothetical protein
VLGVIPAAFAYLLEMMFRTMSIDVLVAVLPIAAAGLVAVPSSRWFWRSLRWILAAVLLKPALALILVIGVGVVAGSTGFIGILAGTAVLLLAVLLPFVLYRMLAFVDPGTDSGRDFRSTAAQFGIGGYGANNPIVRGYQAALKHWKGGNDGDNDARFDDAAEDDNEDGSADTASSDATPAHDGSGSSSSTADRGGTSDTKGPPKDSDHKDDDHDPTTPTHRPTGDADASRSSAAEEAGPEAAL